MLHQSLSTGIELSRTLFILVVTLYVLALPLCGQEQSVSTSQDIDRAMSMSRQAAELEAKGDYTQALDLRRAIVEILVTALGPSDPSTDAARSTVVKLLASLGRYAEARQVLNDCLKSRIQALTENDSRVADTLNQIGETYRREGDRTNSLPFFARAERILEQDKRNPELLATVLNNHGLVLQNLQDYPGAEALFEASLSVLRQAAGINPALAATPLTALGELHRSQGFMVRAKSEHMAALALVTNLPASLPLRLLIDNNLASVCRDEGRWSNAIAIYQHSIEGLSRGRGAADLDLVAVRRNLAQTFTKKGDAAAAESILQECVGALRASARTNSPLYLSLLIDLGSCQQNLGNLIDARGSFDSVLRQALAQGGEEDPLVCASQERLGSLALAQGDLTRAHELLQQALASRQRNAQRDPNRRLELALSMQDWARFERALGRADQADASLQQSLDILAKYRGQGHPDVAEVWEQRGLLAFEDGALAHSLRYHEEARRIRANAFGETNILVAQSDINIACVHFKQTNLVQALKESETACATLEQLVGPDYPLTSMAIFCQANIRHMRGEWDQAEVLYQRSLAAFERQRLRYATVAARDYGLLQLDRGRTNEALQLATRSLQSEESLWRQVLRFGSERDRLSRNAFPDLLTLLAAVAPSDPVPLGTALLRLKGAVLDSLVEERQWARPSLDPDQAATLRALSKARRERCRMEQLTANGHSVAVGELRSADQTIEGLEAKMAERFSAIRDVRHSFTAAIGAVQASLPPDTALVEYVRFRRWLAPGRTEPVFGALVFETNSLRWVELGPVLGKDGIAELVTSLSVAMRANIPPAREDLLATLRSLRERVWDKVAAVMTDRPRWIIIAPDGELNFVPFAALWQGDHFLGEERFFRYVTSARDLLAPPFQPSAQRSVDIWVPDFSRSNGKVGSGSSGVAGPLPENYGPLDSALIEGKYLAASATSNGCSPVKLFAGSAAREAAFRSRPPPYLLALATHATFLPTAWGSLGTIQSANSGWRQANVNAMAWSWLALAGANETLAAMRGRKRPLPEDDGLLTAEEISALDFQGTWLVALSACETGVGTVQAGEGVFGLRRAFALAGARHLLITLWPVWSRETQEFMAAFYADALKSGDAPGALARVQRAKLTYWREKNTPVQAVQWAGPFVLNSNGP